MVSLLDIGNISREVMVRGSALEITGISAKGVLILLERFPEIRMIMSNRADEVTGESISKMLPQALCAIIAAGCGAPGDKAQEEVAGRLTIGEQLEIVDEIFRLTFPQGVRPFVDRFLQFTTQFNNETAEVVVAKPPAAGDAVRGRGQATK